MLARWPYVDPMFAFWLKFIAAFLGVVVVLTIGSAVQNWYDMRRGK